MIGVGLHIDNLLPNCGVCRARSIHVHALAGAVAVGMVVTDICAEIVVHVGRTRVNGVRALLPNDSPRIGVGGIIAVAAGKTGISTLEIPVRHNVAVDVAPRDMIRGGLRRRDRLVAVVRIGERRLRQPGVFKQVVRLQRYGLPHEDGGILRDEHRIAVVGLRVSRHRHHQ